MERKDFLRNTGLAAASFAVTPSFNVFAAANDIKVKLVMIGVGLRGQNHLDLVLRRNDVELVAICDIDDRMLSRSKEMITKSGKILHFSCLMNNYAIPSNDLKTELQKVLYLIHDRY